MSIVLVVIAVWLLIGAWAASRERRIWNNGIAPSGLPWDRFDTDSQGGRGYADGFGNFCWISWPVDRKR